MALEVRHASQPTVHPLQEYVLTLERGSRWQPKIYDRWHLGQWVYPRLIPGRKNALTDAQLLWVELFLMSRGAFLIFMYDNPKDIRARLEGDPNSYLRVDDVDRCVELFGDAWTRSILPGMVTDLPNANTERIIEAATYNHLRYCGMRDAPKRMIGNTWDPEVILVGDELGPANPPEATHGVPFAPYPGASGHYLMNTLLATKLTRRVGIINSLTPSGEIENFYALAHSFPSARFVTLGNEAYNRAIEQLGPGQLSAVPHPQHVRRFRFKEMFRYARDLVRASREPIDLREEWTRA